MTGIVLAKPTLTPDGELIAFPDTEALVVAYLSLALGNDDVATKVPDDRPDRFTRVLVTGGARRDQAHEDVRVTVESWAPTEDQAAADARLARAHLARFDVADGDAFAHYAGEFGRPVSLPDPDSRSPRYVQTVTVRQRAQVL